ncbi:unnamed protein product [Cuscuta epithymum]|uniref:diphosphoinositol-polyphosphate diphosphatase n=1 Tax=Cuscuta epithymum TaxID=186058 RepID=A0AAV0DW00_9ASTE|nr:unnamed protein product [Cuscuta epithymum]
MGLHELSERERKREGTMGLILEGEGDEIPSTRDDDVLLPPSNFSAVEGQCIYRSGLPQPSSFAFLRSLNLSSVIYLCQEPYPEENKEFIRLNNIKLFHFGIDGTKEPSSIPISTITEALRVLIDVRNHPVLIHCKRGKHRTGCLVGCLRKLQNWRLASVLEEYRHFAGTKWRENDIFFLEAYDVSCIRHCLQSLIYRYYASTRNRRILSKEDGLKKTRIASI